MQMRHHGMRTLAKLLFILMLGLLVVAAASCRGCPGEPQPTGKPAVHGAKVRSAVLAGPDARVLKFIVSRAQTPEERIDEATKLAFPEPFATQDEAAAKRRAPTIDIAFSDGTSGQMEFGVDLVDGITEEWNGLPDHYFLADINARGDKDGKVKEADIVIELHVALVARNKDRLELVASGMLADRSKLSIPWTDLEPSKTAGRICALKFDFGRYQIRPDERAFGVRVWYPEAERYTAETYLYLFRLDRAAGTLTPIFDVKLSAKCRTCTTSENNVVIMSRRQTGGFFDILVRNRESRAVMTYRFQGGAYQPPAGALTWSPSLGLERHKEIAAELARVFPADDQVSMRKDEDRQVARSCLDLLRLRAAGHEPATALDESPYLDRAVPCTALRALGKARPARVDYLAGFQLTAAARRYLPPDLEHSLSDDDASKVAAQSKAGKSWLDVNPTSQVQQADGQLTVRDESANVTVRILARGDLDGDGVQDLLVETNDAATEGTYRSARLYVLTRRSLGARLDVVEELKL